MNVRKGSKISQSNKKDILLRNDNQRITGLIVSAGLSSRMGKFKPLLEYDGKPFLINIIDKLLTICKNVIVVTGHNNREIEKTILKHDDNYNGNVKCVYNTDYEKGMFTSIKRGIKECDNVNWVLYHQVDQPNLPIDFYSDFISELEVKYDWIQPTHNDRKGHPILFNRKIMTKILRADSESNLRLISSSRNIDHKYWKCKYKEIFSDIDTPNDFKHLEASK